MKAAEKKPALPGVFLLYVHCICDPERSTSTWNQMNIQFFPFIFHWDAWRLEKSPYSTAAVAVNLMVVMWTEEICLFLQGCYFCNLCSCVDLIPSCHCLLIRLLPAFCLWHMKLTPPFSIPSPKLWLVWTSFWPGKQPITGRKTRQGQQQFRGLEQGHQHVAKCF